jgi:pyruvate formate lyase activating enzyme
VKIGGIQKLTLIDYPGKLAATVFLCSCNFRCPWCYSSEIVLPEKIKKQPEVSEKELFIFLEEKKGLIEGVVLCGGEPTISKELVSLVEKIKKERFFIKLDTNGSNPETMKELIDKKLIDYVAMDIKAPKEKYKEFTGSKIDVKKIQKSIDILKDGKIDYEFRTTVVPGLHTKDDLLKMARWISGAKRYYLQNFRAEKTMDKKFESVKPYPVEFLLEVQKAIAPFFGECQVR